MPQKSENVTKIKQKLLISIGTRPPISLSRTTLKVEILAKRTLLEAPGPSLFGLVDSAWGPVVEVSAAPGVRSKLQPILETSDELCILAVGGGLRIGF